MVFQIITDESKSNQGTYVLRLLHMYILSRSNSSESISTSANTFGAIYLSIYLVLKHAHLNKAL